MAITDRDLMDALAPLTRPNMLELSRRLGVARNTLQARLDRLQRDGVVAGYEPVVDLKAAGFGVLAFMTLEIAQGQESSALHVIGTVPEVLEVHKITGPGDLFCRVVARDNEHLHAVVEAVLTAPGVARTTTTLVLNSPVNRVSPSSAAVAALLGTNDQ